MNNYSRKLITSFSRRERETIQFSVNRYEDQRYIDIRLWYWDPESSELLPTKKGITFPLERMKDFAESVRKLCGSEAVRPEPEQNSSGKAGAAGRNTRR